MNSNQTEQPVVCQYFKNCCETSPIQIICSYNTEDFIIRANIYCSLSGKKKKAECKQHNHSSLHPFPADCYINHSTNGTVLS